MTIPVGGPKVVRIFPTPCTVEQIKRQLEAYFPNCKQITSTSKCYYFQTPKLQKMNEKVGDPWRQMVENRLFNFSSSSSSKLGLEPRKTKRNLQVFSKFNQNTVRWFQVGFRRVSVRNFRGAGDLVFWLGVLWFFLWFLWFFFRLQKNHRAPSSHQHPWNSSEIYLKSPDGVLIELWEKSKVPFCTVIALIIVK